MFRVRFRVSRSCGAARSYNGSVLLSVHEDEE